MENDRLAAEIKSIFQWQKTHDERQNARFDEIRRDIDNMSNRMTDLFTERAERVGAAKAIAELAEARAKRNTFMLALVAGLPSLLTFCSQHHWFGL